MKTLCAFTPMKSQKFVLLVGEVTHVTVGSCVEFQFNLSQQFQAKSLVGFN